MSYFKIYVLFVAIALVSCNKQLNVLPTTSRVDGNAITDVTSARTVLNGVYYRFANAGFDYNQIPITEWYDVQQQQPSLLSGLMIYAGGGSELSDHSYGAESSEIVDIWTWGYQIVNAANGFLKNVEGAPIAGDAKKQMQGEAKFLRAFANATLLLYYGEYNNPASAYGVILREEFVEAGSVNLPRSSVAETYASIIADLDEAISSLPEKNTTAFYTNKSAAKILKARLLINRAAPEDYEEVVNLTTGVIDGGNFSLEAKTKDIFLSKGFNSSEVILGIQPYAGQAAVFQNYQYYHSAVCTDLLVSLLENDPRSSWVYKEAVDDYYGPVNAFTKYYTGDVNNIAPDPMSELGYAFRITEAYLLKAEALTLLGGDLEPAKTLLKEVMSHAEISDFSEVNNAANADELHLAIVKENMRNFAGEAGQDWLALRRLPFTTVQEIIPTLTTTTRLILPVPRTELSENNQIEQTPGY